MIPMLAWRNIWRNKMRSMVIMFSIALGLFAGIAVLSLYKGMMVSRIRTVIEEEVGHIQVHHPQFREDYEAVYTIPDAQKAMQTISGFEGVRALVGRSIAQGMLSTPTGSSGVQVMGIDAEAENKFLLLDRKIKEGRGFDTAKQQQVLVGKKLAAKMKLKPGSRLVLTFTDTSNAIVAGAFRIAGIYQSTNTALDERLVYIRQQELNELLGDRQAIHEIAIKLNRDEDLELLYARVKKAFPSLQSETWKEISPETDFMVKMVDDYSYIIMIIIMVALAFGIINTMLMAIMERTREIGMMVALGTGRVRLFVMVITETIFLTLAGAPAGLLLGWAATAYYSRNGLDLSGMGEEMMASFGFSTMVYPSFPVEKLGAVLLIVGGTALVSGIFPAIRALRMKPVDALRQ